jgi:hypothetical protein
VISRIPFFPAANGWAERVETPGAGYRIRSEATLLELRVGGRLVPPSALVRLGPTGMLVSGPLADDALRRDLVNVTIRFAGVEAGPLMAQVEALPAAEAAGAWWLRFVGLERADAQRVLALVRALARSGLVGESAGRARTTETFTDPDRLRSALNALAAHRCAGFARGADGRTVAVTAAGFDESAALPAVWQCEGPLPAPPVSFAVVGLMSVFDFVVDRAEPAGGLLATGLPASIRRVRRRSARRVRGRPALRVAATHPHWPDVTVVGDLHDVSRGGLSIQSTPVDQLLYPGLVLPAVEVVEGDLEGVRLTGSVRHVGLGGDAATGTCGLSLEAEGDDGRWQDEVERCLHPNTRARGTWSGHLWDLFQEAGYFNLGARKAAHFVHLRRQFGNVIRRFEQAPGIACQVSWVSEAGVEGASTAVRAYEGTWFGFHMARRKGEALGRDVLRDVHVHIYEHALEQGDLSWMLSYIRADAAWPRVAHVEFARRHEATGEGCLVRFRTLTGGTRGIPGLRGGYAVGPAEDADLALLAARADRDRPRAYVEAFDLVPERMRMTDLERRWAAAGLGRQRALRVARRGGAPAAISVLETASDAVHLYGLLDTVRLYPLEEGGEAAFADLIEDARAWFAALGKETFAYLEEYPGLDAARAGLTDLGLADIVLYATRLLPDAMEHVWEMTSGRTRT